MGFMPKSFKSLEDVLSALIDSDGVYVRFENRRKKYMFGCNNYGEVPSMYNIADRDPWDIFAPGYEFHSIPFDQNFKVKAILGYLKLNNGNHKIAVRLYVPGWSYEDAKQEIVRFCKRYTKRVADGTWVSLDPNFNIIEADNPHSLVV